MGNVERSDRVFGHSEPFNDEAEDAVRYHIQRVERSVRFIFYYSYNCERQKHSVEDEFRLTRGPSDGVRMYERYDLTLTAPGKQAVHTGAGEREQERYRHQIEHSSHIALKDLRAEEIQQRHEEHGAVQAHRAFESAAGRFEERKELYRRNTEHDMQRGNDQKRVPFRPQPFTEGVKPEEREDRGYAEQKVQGMFSDKLHFFLLFIFRRAKSHR